MRSLTFSSTLIGIEAHLVGVEVVVSNGLPGLTVVGLPDAAVSEAGARVRSALKLTGVNLPPRRMVVNLAPADLRKTGSGFDLALALGLLEAMGEIPQGILQDSLVVGELSLAGEVRGVRGVVCSLTLARRTERISRILLPACQIGELPQWSDIEVVPIENLEQAMRYCRGEVALESTPSSVMSSPKTAVSNDLRDVRGQALAKLGLEIAAAGGHHLALSGPPGCGKSLLASCLPGLLPPMTEWEVAEVAAIASVCQERTDSRVRPFRAPGNGISSAALLGGHQPGEVTRAHRGVLFLDEFPEFRRDSLEALRVVLEEGQVKISRARFRTIYPAHFTLVCAMNPCPCGRFGVAGEICICTPNQVQRYRSKLSGPLLDRFDLLVSLTRVPLVESSEVEAEESSEAVAQRVSDARKLQADRGFLNRDLRGPNLLQALGWKNQDRAFAYQLAESSRLSMRAFEKWLRVARTVADLKQAESVSRRELLIARSVRFSVDAEESLVS